MSFTRAVVPLLALLGTARAATSIFTGGFDIWNIPDNATWIREVNTTLNLPQAPNPEGDMSIWCGMITDNGDFIQALALSYAQDQTVTVGECDNLGKNNWCAVSSTLKKNGDSQTMGKGNAVATPGSSMTSHYIYNDQTGKYDQTTYVNGKQVSFLSTTSGHGITITANTECNTNPNCGTVPAFTWSDTTIVLDAPVSSYGHGLTLIPGGSGKFTSPDGGKTWNMPTAHIPQRMLPQQQGQASVPSQ